MEFSSHTLALRNQFSELMSSLRLEDEAVNCKVISADWARLPSREYALMRGKEVILHCEIGSWCGQAFTDNPQPFTGKVKDVARMPLTKSGNRAIFFAALNALMHAAGRIDGTLHCKGTDAEKCGELLVNHIVERFGKAKVLHVGFQPGHVKALASALTTVYVTDLNSENVGKVKHGVKILDGRLNRKLIKKVDVVYITGSAIVNGTLFPLLAYCSKLDRKCVLYGVTAKGAAKILGYEVFCPYGRNG